MQRNCVKDRRWSEIRVLTVALLLFQECKMVKYLLLNDEYLFKWKESLKI